MFIHPTHRMLLHWKFEWCNISNEPDSSDEQIYLYNLRLTLTKLMIATQKVVIFSGVSFEIDGFVFH